MLFYALRVEQYGRNEPPDFWRGATCGPDSSARGDKDVGLRSE
jgi:hypothetical protein